MLSLLQAVPSKGSGVYIENSETRWIMGGVSILINY